MVKNILKYLRRIKELILAYKGLDNRLGVKSYTDTSFQTNMDDFKL
jgi:hypothetical protein